MSRIQLKSIKYSEGLGGDKEWTVDLPLSQVNLLVGKNATGKTRTLNVIAGFSRLLTSTPRFMVNHGSYEVLFDNDGVTLRYIVRIEGGVVVDEQYFIGESRVLFRGIGVEGEIEMHSIGSEPKMVRFSPPENELAVLILLCQISPPNDAGRVRPCFRY